MSGQDVQNVARNVAKPGPILGATGDPRHDRSEPLPWLAMPRVENTLAAFKKRAFAGQEQRFFKGFQQ